MFGLHPELQPIFYKIVLEVLQNSPIEAKWGRDRITETLTIFLVFNYNINYVQ